MGSVRYEVNGALAIITLDCASTRNAIGPVAEVAIAEFALDAAENPDVRLVVLTGADGVFCSGAAIREWEQMDNAGETLTDRGSALCELLATLAVPVLAALPGHAVGGGAELALAADWRIADPAAELRFVHAGFGLIPGFGGLGRLDRLVGPATALRLLATRARVGAEEAERLGLIEAIVPTVEQLAWAEALAALLADSDRRAVAEIKNVLADGDERDAFLRVWPNRQLPDRLGS
ncbi:MAG: enoyl-CoA hydratase/isomerase family protein [Gaiellales bacterium]